MRTAHRAAPAPSPQARGCGFEDAAWYVAHETLLDEPPRRHEGRVYALHHQAETRAGEQYDANAALMEGYRDAAISPDSMSEFVFGAAHRVPID